MIPKIIHYCWFGPRPFGDLENRCLESWKKIFPDYEIKKWGNECLSQFDNRYLRQAVEAKKWAFVSDYVRLYALLTEGGIYFDTDEEVLKNLDEFMDHDFFIGSQKCGSAREISPALIGTIPNNPLVKDLLSVYDEVEFIKPDGSHNLTTNPKMFARVLKAKYGLTDKDLFVTKDRVKIMENSYIYPYYFFCTDNEKAYAIHHYSGSWTPIWRIKKKLSFSIGKTEYILKKYKHKPRPGEDEPMPIAEGEKIVYSFSTGSRSQFILFKKAKG